MSSGPRTPISDPGAEDDLMNSPGRPPIDDDLQGPSFVSGGCQTDAKPPAPLETEDQAAEAKAARLALAAEQLGSSLDRLPQFHERRLRVARPHGLPASESDPDGPVESFVGVQVYDMTHETVGFRKPFLGGFRSRDRQFEYHNASAQTHRAERPTHVRRIHVKETSPSLVDGDSTELEGEEESVVITRSEIVKRVHRAAQTVRTKTRSAQTLREQGVQMERPGLYIDSSRDRIVEIPEAGLPYFSATEYDALKLQKIVKIQSLFRGFLARRRARKLREEHASANREVEEEERNRRALKAQREQVEKQRRMYPKTRADFDVLYKELRLWKRRNVAEVNMTSKTEQERRSRLAELLRQETKLLQTIDRLKITANRENQIGRVNRMLEYLARPHRRKVVHQLSTKVAVRPVPKTQLESDDEVEGENRVTDEKELVEVEARQKVSRVEIETPLTIRARELMDLHQGLNTENLSIDERLDVLLHVKWTVKEFDCQLTRDMVELIDREADLLNRGRKGRALGGLRRRLSNLFLQFIETPQFNPAVKKLRRRHVDYANVVPLPKTRSRGRSRRRQ